MQDPRIDELKNLLSSDGKESRLPEDLSAQIVDSLNPKQKQLLEKALKNRQFAESLLQSPQATELLKKLNSNGGEKNGA